MKFVGHTTYNIARLGYQYLSELHCQRTITHTWTVVSSSLRPPYDSNSKTQNPNSNNLCFTSYLCARSIVSHWLVRFTDSQQGVGSEHRESKSPGRSPAASFVSRNKVTMVSTKTKILSTAARNAPSRSSCQRPFPRSSLLDSLSLL
jgi:hypothetical protein